jgi:hypothetical protein
MARINYILNNDMDTLSYLSWLGVARIVVPMIPREVQITFIRFVRIETWFRVFCKPEMLPPYGLHVYPHRPLILKRRHNYVT